MFIAASSIDLVINSVISKKIVFEYLAYSLDDRNISRHR